MRLFLQLLPILVVCAPCLGTTPPPPPGPATAGGLPPVECVRMLRSARARLESGDTQACARLLREAVERFPDQRVALSELWSFHRHFGLPAEEAARLREILTARLADPASGVPAGVLEYLVHDPEADPEDLERLLAATVARSDGDDVATLEAVATLQLRLERRQEARETYRRMMQLAPSENLRWRCIQLDVEDERWEEVVLGLQPVVASETVSFPTRMMYIEACG